MEGFLSGSGHQLIGGIAIDPTAVQGKDPTTIVITGESADCSRTRGYVFVEQPPAELMNNSEESPQAKSAALPGHEANFTAVVKKPRGRPKKAQLVPESVSAAIPAVKRGRGRPRKIAPPVVVGASSNGAGSTIETITLSPILSVIEHTTIDPDYSSNSKPVLIDPEYEPTSSKPILSIIDPEYQSSCIDKTIENIYKSKPSAQLPTATGIAKRPVGRPRKRPRNGSTSVLTKQAKVAGNGEDRRNEAIPKSTKLKISKEMVNRMIGKSKSDQETLTPQKPTTSTVAELPVEPPEPPVPIEPPVLPVPPVPIEPPVPSKPPGEGKEKVLAPGIKRGRGRPRKNEGGALTPTRGSNKEEAKMPTPPEVKKGPGRPWKGEEKVPSPAPVVKRGPGRPRKGEEKVPSPVVKRGPGRPRKGELSPVVKRGPGRPRKGEPSPVVKRGPGRPRKGEEKVLSPTDTPVVKRGPGRPRKGEEKVPNSVPVIKKGPGRPRKGEEKMLTSAVKRGRGRPRKVTPFSDDKQEVGVSGSGDQEEVGVARSDDQEEVDGVESVLGQSPIIEHPLLIHPPAIPLLISSLPSSPDPSPLPHSPLPPSPTKSIELEMSFDASLSESPTKKPAPMEMGGPPDLLGNLEDYEDSEAGVMGKLQVSFSESESECSDPMDFQRSAIDALTHRVAPPMPHPHQALPPMPHLIQPTLNSPLFIDNKFEESFDEDSDN